MIRKEIADIHNQQGKIQEAKDELLELLAFQKAGGYPSICLRMICCRCLL